ncbi:hypothetical protein FKM82_020005, partial [Ascaphus truei]
MADLWQYVTFTDPNFAVALLCVVFNPLFWNVVARWEHRTRSLSRFLGSPYTGCYSLGAVLIFLAMLRSHCFTEAMKTQPRVAALENLGGYYVGLVLVGAGAVLVVSSFLSLGFAGTYLGKALPVMFKGAYWGLCYTIV